MSTQPLSSTVLRSLRAATAGLWALLIGVWLAAVGGSSLPMPIAQAILFLAALASLLTLAADLSRQLRHSDGEARRDALILLGLVLVSVIISWIGIDHEVGRGYYRDEGHYLKHANLVGEGRFFTATFIYPHFLYYLDAFSLWLASLAPTVVRWISGGLYGIPEGPAVPWLVLRAVAATLGALTVVPVYRLGRRLAGAGAGLMAGLAIIFSEIYSAAFSVNISDGPSAFFAACCLAASGALLDEERPRNYILAGVAAGLAAGTKYPAGVVAVAIVGVWAHLRYQKRDFRPGGLLIAGLTAIATFIAATPSFVLYPGSLFGPQGILFGIHQYGKGGWLGVMPSSNTLYYLEKIVFNFGWPLLLLGLIGAALLSPRARSRTVALLPFPIVYFALICAMNMVVERNLFPLLPALAVLVGVGAAAALGRLAEPPTRTRLAAATLVGLAALALPATRTLETRIGLARPSTRDMMVSWVRDNLPRGAAILKESYTADFSPGEYSIRKSRFVARLPIEEIRSPRFDAVLVASNAYLRFLNEERLVEEHHLEMRKRYLEIFDALPLLHEEAPGRFRQGPRLKLYQVDPEPIVHLETRDFAAREAFRPGRPRQDDSPDRIAFRKHRRWVSFRDYFAAGTFAVTVHGSLRGAGSLEVTDRSGRIQTGTPISQQGSGRLELPADDKYLLTLRLPPGSRVDSLSITRAADPLAAAGPPAGTDSQAGDDSQADTRD